MKKHLLKSIFALALILVGTGCSEDFLDKHPTSFISVDDVGYSGERNPDILDATLTGIYTMMINTGTGGTSSHDDFGQKGYDIFSDFLSSDMALSVSTYGWYSRFVDYQTTTDYTRTENYKPWRYYYRVIKSTNLVIASLGGNEATPESVAGKHAMGQAKALRAYAYFYLSQFFIKEYDATSAVLPIYTDPTQAAQPASTTAELYNLMISDLESAILLLDGFERTSKTPINVDVARGLLAYVYGSMDMSENNVKAKNLADQVIGAGYPLMTATEITGGFNNVSTPGWIWGVDVTIDTGLGLVSWWGQMDVFTYSYQWAGDRKAMDSDLYDAIPANDARKAQFYPTAGGYYLIPINKFYDVNRNIGGQRDIEMDYIFMRVSEMYLLSAEMSAKQGDDATAQTRLKQVLAQRFASAADYAYVDALTGQALQDEIYLQTRIELWGEGKSYLAMKRNKATITRGANHLYHVGVAIPYNDDRLSWVIPQSEIQNNPHLN